MKSQATTLFRASMILLMMVACAFAEAPKVGDNEQRVRTLMGAPKGVMKLDKGVVIYSYASGDITFTNGRVTEVDLLPAGKTWKTVAGESKAQLDREKAKDVAEARKLLAAMVENERYRKASPEEKMNQLKRFAGQNPGVDIDRQIEEVKAEAKVVAELRRQEDIAREREKIHEEEKKIQRRNELYPQIYVYPGTSNSPPTILINPPARQDFLQ